MLHEYVRGVVIYFLYSQSYIFTYLFIGLSL